MNTTAAAKKNSKNKQAPRVFGRSIYEGQMIIKPGKPPSTIPVKISIGRLDLEVYDMEFKKCFHPVKVEAGKATLMDDNVIQIEYKKSGKSIEFQLIFDRNDLIINFFPKPPDEEGKKGKSTVTKIPNQEILPFGSCQTKETLLTRFRTLLEAQAKKRVIFLSSMTSISEAQIRAISCEFRLRFLQVEPENWEEAFDVLWKEFVAFTISLWAQCLNLAIAQHTGQNSVEYFRRLAVCLAAQIAKGADIFKVDRQLLLLSTRKFFDIGDSKDIYEAAKSIVVAVQSDVGELRSRWLLQTIDLFEFSQLFSGAITIAQSIQNDMPELRDLSNQLVMWSLGMTNNLIKPPRVQDFTNSLEKLAAAVVKAKDNDRYSPEFHLVFALWKLAELAKSVE